MKAFWIGFATVLAANSPAVIFSRKPDAPYYWSGTNCRGIGSPAGYDARGANPEKGIAEYKIEINGTVVFNQPHIVPGDWFRAGGGSVVFDSSHFSNGTTVEVKSFAKAIHVDGSIDVNWTNDGGYSAVVKNKSLAIMTGADDFMQQGIPLALPRQTLFSNQMRYLTTEIPGTVAWTHVTFLDSLMGKANLFINTHGPTGLPELCDSNLPYGSQHDEDNYTIFPSGILGRRIQSDIGEGRRPPFNPSGEPPVQIGIIFSCNQASNSIGWRNAFLWPGLNDYNDPAYTNQVIVAFQHYLVINNNCLLNLTNRYLTRLTEGENVGNAAFLEFSEFAPPKPNERVFVVTSRDPLVFRLMEEADFAFGGDDTARMSGVYTGNDLKMLNWWRN